MTKLIDQKLKQPATSAAAPQPDAAPERADDSFKNPSLHKETKPATEKEEDTRAAEHVPDNDRDICATLGTPPSLVAKARRSESLKRSDSLSKTEKTESNINKRRELLSSGRRFKETATKHKRKNGTPDRSIKRRHTVGGTKDPDKVTYLMDNRRGGASEGQAQHDKEKGIRTSSPDLSGSRRDRFLVEINLMAALKQHLIGNAQNFSEPKAFKVPLESHV